MSICSYKKWPKRAKRKKCQSYTQAVLWYIVCDKRVIHELCAISKCGNLMWWFPRTFNQHEFGIQFSAEKFCEAKTTKKWIQVKPLEWIRKRIQLDEN